MDVYEKLDLLVKKAEELDEIGDELTKANDKIQERCISQAAMQIADELEKLGNMFTDDDIDEIHNALSEDELQELQQLIDEN